MKVERIFLRNQKEQYKPLTLQLPIFRASRALSLTCRHNIVPFVCRTYRPTTLLRRKYECNYKCPCADRLKTGPAGSGEEPRDCGLRASQVCMMDDFVCKSYYQKAKLQLSGSRVVHVTASSVVECRSDNVNTPSREHLKGGHFVTNDAEKHQVLACKKKNPFVGIKLSLKCVVLLVIAS